MMPSDPPATESEMPKLTERRFSLRQLMKEVTRERRTGALGHEKLHQKNIRTIVRASRRKPRDT
jgi:hypothetical protein